MKEREGYSLDDIEKDPEEMRYILILDDNWKTNDEWIKVFQAEKTRCLVPQIYSGYSTAVYEKLNPEKVVMVIADWFYDSPDFVREECQEVVDWLRGANPETFVVEESFACTRGRRLYQASNLSVNTLELMLNDEFAKFAMNPKGTREERIFFLQQLIVPELAWARDLNEGPELAEPKMMHLYFQLEESEYYQKLLDELSLEDIELGMFLLGVTIKEAVVFLHCAYSYVAQHMLKHDERYYSMALSRMKLMLEDFRRWNPGNII